jgi:hypothetical protein
MRETVYTLYKMLDVSVQILRYLSAFIRVFFTKLCSRHLRVLQPTLVASLAEVIILSAPAPYYDVWHEDLCDQGM